MDDFIALDRRDSVADALAPKARRRNERARRPRKTRRSTTTALGRG
jgi:hypothetical protein